MTSDVARWMSLGAPHPFRLNLRYATDHAELRLTGDLTESSVPELERLLAVLEVLPARLVVDTRDVSSAVPAVHRLLTATAGRRTTRTLADTADAG